MFNSFNSRWFYKAVNIKGFARLVGNYEYDIDNASVIFQNVKCYGKDALDLSASHAEDRNTVWYHDIPYSETNADNYVASWFDEVRFTKCLSECAGDYIVASRFNIRGENDNAKTEKRTKKQYRVIKFFSRFLADEDVVEYKEAIKKEYATIVDESEEC